MFSIVSFVLQETVLPKEYWAAKNMWTEPKQMHALFAANTAMPFLWPISTMLRLWSRKWKNGRLKYKSLYDPAKALAYEDLFRFEYTDSEYIFQQSFEAWCAFFLQTFGDIKAPIVERVLLAYKNSTSRPPRSPYEETIYNFDDVKKTFEGSKFNDSLSR